MLRFLGAEVVMDFTAWLAMLWIVGLGLEAAARHIVSIFGGDL